MFRYFTAGESHGRALCAVIDGMPAGVPLSPDVIDAHLARRQQGYGRGNRMKIEADKVDILSGVRFGKTIGSPISLLIENRDWKNWTEKMSQFEDKSESVKKIHVPRPGHADFAGRVKYGFDDIRPVIERSSARETAARVAACSVARQFLKTLGVEIGSYLSAIGQAIEPERDSYADLIAEGAEALAKRADASPTRMIHEETEAKAIALIDEAKRRGDTLGGVIEVFVTGLPIGLGSYAQHDRKLDAQLAAAIVSIQAVKGVEIGTAFRNATRFGSEVHDELFMGDDGKPYRKTNRAGGIEGGMTNGEFVHLRVAMKPISTLMNPLRSVNLDSMREELSHIERSDACAAPACAIVAESVIAPVLMNAILEKFGGDSLDEIQARIADYDARCNKALAKR
ncbi:MAG: chorismate synthase [Chloroherpetonaceae bacterium]|nr:chorismate synthase [Chloroherpetonaceae bacterium]MDW8436998.1 chorismate synthase [Chloroherpetonaceae bacterium]